MEWSAEEQRALELALRRHPPAADKAARWRAIAADVGRPVKECAARCRALQTAVLKTLPPPLLRLQSDAQFCLLELLEPKSLCAIGCVCRELRTAARADDLWRRVWRARLPPQVQYETAARAGEPVWKACLRVHWALHGPWHKLAGHSKGLFPYLREYGVLAPPSASARGLARFTPTAGSLPARVTYGAVAEMVQLAACGGPISAELYKEVAAFLESHNRNERTASQPLHMAVREIYKTCYPGHGSGAGAATGVAPGVIPGGSSTGGALTGRLASLCLGSGLSDEEMRKRLDTTHEFFALVSH